MFTTMNDTNKLLLKKLKKMQYYDFLTRAIGMKVFLENSGNTFSYKSNRGRNYFKVLGCWSDGKKSVIYYVNKEDYGEKIFHSDNGETHNARAFFDTIESRIVTALLLSSIGIDSIDEIDYSKIDLDFGKSILEKKKLSDFSFIIGAGANKDDNLGISIGKWEELINEMQNAIRIDKGLPIPTIPVTTPPIDPDSFKPKDSLINFEESICNTNYIAPQLLKIQNETEYYKVIYANMYSSFNPATLSLATNPKLVNTSLYQIARIIQKRRASFRILTFNYDDIFEQIIEYNFKLNYQSVYKTHKLDSTYDVHIIHSHGFYPYGKPAFRKGIVLSTYEYLKSYKTVRSYARKLLNEQLETVNILVGNSLSDYEEQKVFYSHYIGTPSKWHFIFLKRNEPKEKWMDIFILKYFMKMGVIPVFFDNFPNMYKYLKTF